MNQVWRHCPVCEGTETRPHWSKSSVTLVQCRSCGMVFANPIQAEMADASHYNHIAARYYLAPAKLASDFSPVRYAREVRLLQSRCPSGRVLDVGCCTGGFLYALQQTGRYKVLGADAASPALAHARQLGIPTLDASFLRHDFGDLQFDALTFWAVLEHVVNPMDFLRKAASLTVPMGWVFVLVPNLDSLAMRWLGPRYRYVMAEHLNYFTRATLRRLAESIGQFRVECILSTHWNPVVLWQDWRRGGSEPTEKERLDLLQRTTVWKQRRCLAPARVLYRLFELGLGRVNLADNLVMMLQRNPNRACPD